MRVAETATLAHGYSMGHVESLARGVAELYRSSTNPSETYETAWRAIVTRLYELGGEMPCSCAYPPHRAPSHDDLWRAGWQAARTAEAVQAYDVIDQVDEQTVGQTWTGDDELPHGYTVGELNTVANIAARYRPSSMVDPDDAISIAWCAALEALRKAEDWPSRNDLIRAASTEVRREFGYQKSFRGLGSSRRAREQGHIIAPSFEKYWRPVAGDHADFTDSVADRLSLPAVLAVLTPKQYEAISTLAAFDGDFQAAADALGTDRNALHAGVRRAREQLKALWFEHETPRARVGGKTKAAQSRYNRTYRDRKKAEALAASF